MAVPNQIVNKFKAKYQHLSEFFQFIGVNSTKVKDTYQIIFKCKKCLPQKEVKANIRTLTSKKSHYDVQKTSQKYLLQILQICNRIFPNLFAIAICNKWNLIALQFICNKPVIYWLMSGPNEWN